MEAIKTILAFLFLVAVFGCLVGAYVAIKLNQKEDLSKPNNDYD